VLKRVVARDAVSAIGLSAASTPVVLAQIARCGWSIFGIGLTLPATLGPSPATASKLKQAQNALSRCMTSWAVHSRISIAWPFDNRQISSMVYQ